MFAEFIRKYLAWIIVGALLLAANVIVYFLLTYPKINAEAIEREEMERVQQRQSGLRNELAGIAAREKRILAFSSALKDFYSNTLISIDNLEDLVRERNRIAQRNGMQPDRTRYPSEVIRGQPLSRFAMIFPLQGSYASLRSFLNEVETSEKYFLIIDAVELNSSESREELSMQITVSSYLHDPTLEEALAASEEGE